MPNLTGRIETQFGARYLAQLCKHFAHRIEASYVGNHGRAEFVYGPAVMEADPEGLTIRFEVHDATNIDGAKHVIDSHLARFAHREKITEMDWAQD